MPLIHLFAVVGLLISGLCSVQAGAQTISNIAREKNWAEQIVDSVVVGEAVWLNARQHNFLGLYAAPAETSSWAVILLHGRGVHPAWGFFDSLRADIADAGWHTLSLQLPILEQDAKFGSYGQTFPETYDRIDSGIRFLKQKGVNHIFLLGHSTGAMSAVAYAARYPRMPLAGVVAIGLSTFANGVDAMQPVLMLKRVRLPLLDIYGANDLHEVLSYVSARRSSAAAAGNKGYSAIRVAGADHFFTDKYEALKKNILDWLSARKRT